MARVDGQWQLHLIRPIPIDPEKPVTATLLVTLDANGLQNQLAPGNPALGQTRLTQITPNGGRQLLAQTGSALDGERHEVTIPDSHWHLTFTSADGLRLQAQELPALWLVFMAASLGGSLILAGYLGMGRPGHSRHPPHRQ